MFYVILPLVKRYINCRPFLNVLCYSASYLVLYEMLPISQRSIYFCLLSLVLYGMMPIAQCYGILPLSQLYCVCGRLPPVRCYKVYCSLCCYSLDL
jgi:hypothetical protein